MVIAVECPVSVTVSVWIATTAFTRLCLIRVALTAVVTVRGSVIVAVRILDPATAFTRLSLIRIVRAFVCFLKVRSDCHILRDIQDGQWIVGGEEAAGSYPVHKLVSGIRLSLHRLTIFTFRDFLGCLTGFDRAVLAGLKGYDISASGKRNINLFPLKFAEMKRCFKCLISLHIRNGYQGEVSGSVGHKIAPVGICQSHYNSVI